MEVEGSEHAIRSLVGRELSGVVFIRDYIQLQFDDRGLTAVTLPIVIASGQAYSLGMQGYRDALCERIGQRVADASSREGEEIKLKFADGSAISISLREQDYVGPEAAIYDGPKQTCVW